MRHNCFTSSEISDLCTFDKSKQNPGKPFYTYIKEKKKQSRLGKSFSGQGSTATKWGNHFEPICFDRYKNKTGLHLLSYSNFLTDFRTSHLPNHGGTPDFGSFDQVIAGSIKCPFTESAFIDLSDICDRQDLEYFKKENPEYYWQILSDKIVLDAKECHFVIFMPYKDEVEELLTDSELYWLTNPPFLLRDSEFTDLKSWVFEAPQNDIDFLTERIELASKEYNKPNSSTIIISGDKVGNSDILIVEPASLLSKLTKI